MSLKRKPRPQPWEEMDDDMLSKPNIRRRIPPPYEPSDESPGYKNTPPPIIREVKEPKPLEATIMVQSEDSANDQQMKTIANLKSILKQSSGSVSLSEILQQKNISLSELLKGNQAAISALTSKPPTSTEPPYERTTESDLTTKYKRLPPSVGLKRNISRYYEQDTESQELISNRELLEAQKRRLSLLNSHKENKIFSSVTKFDVVTEPITEKRIFVPSHPKYYTSLNYKPDMTMLEQSTESISQLTAKKAAATTATTSTTTETSVKIKPTDLMYLKPKLKGSSQTTAKKVTTKATKKPSKVIIENKGEVENYPLPFDFPAPIKIKLTEVTGFKLAATSEKSPLEFDFPEDVKVNNAETGVTKGKKQEDRPLRVPIQIMTEPSPTTTAKPTTLKDVQEILSSSSESSTYMAAKVEIDEILRDEHSRKELSEILATRNMTIDELVEQRERGSSQLHLADIFHNKTREPEPREAPLIGKIIPDVPKSNRQQKSSTFKEESTNQYISILNVKPTKEAVLRHESTHFPTVKMDKNVQSFSWKQMYPDLFPELFKKDTIIPKPDIIGSAEEVQLTDETDTNTISLASNEQFSANLADEEDLFFSIPTGVKSAIFVSFAIIGLSIIVFLTILVVFRWAQRHRRKLNYSSSLTTKLRSPIIMQSNPTSTLKTFMNDTLGRKHYYKSNVRSATEDLWDCERNRKESF